MAVLDKENN